MRLDLTLGGSVIPFTPVNEDGPYPYLDSVSLIHFEAIAGDPETSGGARPSAASAVLNNGDKRVAALIGNPPRVRGDIYDDAGAPVFSGFVESITYGQMIELAFQS